MVDEEKIKFSFEYYDCSGKYCLSDWGKKNIKASLERLKDINTKTFIELTHANNSRVYHFQEVHWEKTMEKNGFPDKRVKSLSHFHFAILGVNNQRARVYGAYYAGTFYIIWFDLNHRIWPTEKRNTH